MDNIINKEEAIRELLGTFGILTKKQVIKYISLLTNMSQEEADKYITRLIATRKIFASGELLQVSAGVKLNRRTILAFHVYLSLLEGNDIGQSYFKAGVPSDIGFILEDEVYVITICDNKYKDPNVIALREKNRYGSKSIVAGSNFSFDEMIKDMLPEEDLLFCELRFKSPFVIEQMSFRQVKKEEITKQ